MTTKKRKKRKTATGHTLHGVGGQVGKIFNTKSVLSSLKTGGLILAGYIGGAQVRKMLDPILVKEGENDKIKKYISEILLLGGGLVLANNKREVLKHIGLGLMGAGGVGVVNKVTNKSLLTDGVMGLDNILTGLRGLPILEGGPLPEYPVSLPMIEGDFVPTVDAEATIL